MFWAMVEAQGLGLSRLDRRPVLDFGQPCALKRELQTGYLCIRDRQRAQSCSCGGYTGNGLVQGLLEAERWPRRCGIEVSLNVALDASDHKRGKIASIDVLDRRIARSGRVNISTHGDTPHPIREALRIVTESLAMRALRSALMARKKMLRRRPRALELRAGAPACAQF